MNCLLDALVSRYGAGERIATSRSTHQTIFRELRSPSTRLPRYDQDLLHNTEEYM